jgi:hypothetical protein
MQRRIRIAAVTLYLLIGLALWSQAGRGAQANPLDPSTFTSLGASPFTQNGVYAINASKDNAAPTAERAGYHHAHPGHLPLALGRQCHE